MSERDLPPRPDGLPFSLSKHAIERALEMSVDGEEIARAIERPEKSYFSHRHHKWCYTAGRVSLGISVREGRAEIVTVLWSTKQGWLDDYARGGTTDRTRRTVITTSM